MKRIILIAAIVNVLVLSALGQRGGPPRRVSDPQDLNLPGGSRIEFKQFDSSSLGRLASYSIFLPPSYFETKQDYPVIYFLHGMWNDHTSWTVQRYGNIPVQLEDLLEAGKIGEFIAVNPDGENSFYTDYLDGSLKFEQMVCRDLVQEIEQNYRVKKGRRYRAISGVSMGGYGAIKISFKNPNEFASVAGFSPIVLLGKDPSRQIMQSSSRLAGYLASALKPIYGMPFDLEHWEENSLTHLAQTAELNGLKIFFGWGTADRYNDMFPMEKGVRTLHKILDERDIEHRFKVYEGGPHGWGLVTENLEEVLRFLTQTF
jgi:enterochelin esterase family protein